MKIKRSRRENINIKDDFELYGKYLYQDGLVDIPKDINIVMSNIDKLIPKFLNKELVNHRFNYLQNEFSNFNKLSLFERKFKHRYCLFTKEELNTIFNDCVNYIIKEIIKLGDNKMPKEEYTSKLKNI